MATKKHKSGLGRGLDALLGGSTDLNDALPDIAGAPSSLSIDVMQAGKYQPRTRMDEGALNELAASIRAQGMLQAILVRPVASHNGTQRYEIIAGERRFRAAQLAGLDTVPVLVKDVDDQAISAGCSWLFDQIPSMFPRSIARAGVSTSIANQRW